MALFVATFFGFGGPPVRPGTTKSAENQRRRRRAGCFGHSWWRSGRCPSTWQPVGIALAKPVAGRRRCGIHPPRRPDWCSNITSVTESTDPAPGEGHKSGHQLILARLLGFSKFHCPVGRVSVARRMRRARRQRCGRKATRGEPVGQGGQTLGRPNPGREPDEPESGPVSDTGANGLPAATLHRRRGRRFAQ